MPIGCNVEIFQMKQGEFHAVDQLVMRHVFDMHNSMGRFCDERIYQEELARRCRSAGLEVELEVHLKVSHQDFSKSYYLDLLIERGGLYELKAVEALNTSHEMQTINYLLLSELKHGKLVNLRASSVESRFVSTSLSRQSRAEFQLRVEEFEEVTDLDRFLRSALCALLDDWGAFLDANLYREALLHFLNGPKAGFQPVEIAVDGFLVGSQRMCVLDDETAWHLSAARIHLPSYETHLFRLFNHTRFKRVHWINFDQRKITLKTLKK
jgi:GxxExxY protein